MDDWLKDESVKLARSWMQHDATVLGNYLVADVEDPRLNAQSVLARHFLIRALTGDRFNGLMEEEMRFAAAMNWLCALARGAGAPEEFELILQALRRGADNAEGMEIPHFLLRIFGGLPARVACLSRSIPNYIDGFLRGSRLEGGLMRLDESSLNTFQVVWQAALAAVFAERSGGRGSRDLAGTPVTEGAGAASEGGQGQWPSVLEPACGSANDYRFLHAYGIAQRLNYSGFDLCAKNIQNSRERFPGVRFEVGNVFEIGDRDRSYDLCVVQDLFEHLSPKGLEVAVGEICRVTRERLCVGFFNMDEMDAHRIQPVEDYFWNTLSLERIQELFASHGFAAQVIHIGTFLRQLVGCEQTHNLNAYTFLLFRERR